jgi:hypothetical protein
MIVPTRGNDQVTQALRRFCIEDMTMADPLDKATSNAPATLGEGCLSRYDPDDMSPEDGTEFPGAAELWEQLQQEPEVTIKPA